MLIYFALIIPVLVAIVLLILFKHKIVWWELVVPFVASLIFIVISKAIISHVAVQSTEYWGSIITKAEYYEDWNEYIEQTCTRSCCCDSKGENCGTETYDCSYVKYHDAYWEITTTSGEVLSIPEYRFTQLANFFGQKTFVELNRDYYTNDGDLWVTNWPGDSAKAVPVTTKHSYVNKVKAADQSVFHFRPVSKQDVEQYHLKKYPTINQDYEMVTILGDSTQDAYLANKKLQYINGDLGPSKQLKVFVLVFKNQPIEAAFFQEWLWSGGNKNEFIVCVGIGADRTPQWCHPISWTTNEKLKLEVRDWVMDQKKLNLCQLADYLYPKLKKDFVRREFKEFNYLTVQPSTTSIIITFLLTLIISIGLGIWAVKNEIE